MFATEHVDEVVASLPESEQFHLPGRVHNHQLARQGVQVLRHLARLCGKKVRGEDLGAVGAQIVFVHDLGQRNQLADVVFSVVMDPLSTGVKVDGEHFGLKEPRPALEGGHQG